MDKLFWESLSWILISRENSANFLKVGSSQSLFQLESSHRQKLAFSLILDTQDRVNDLCSLFHFILRGKRSKCRQLTSSTQRHGTSTDGTHAFFGRCFNSETNYTKSPNISAKVNFCKFSTILLARNTYEGTTRFTLSRKPTWISFKRRCCGNLCQLIVVDVWNTCGRSQTPKLRGLHSLSDKNFASSHQHTHCFNFTAKASVEIMTIPISPDHEQTVLFSR